MSAMSANELSEKARSFQDTVVALCACTSSQEALTMLYERTHITESQEASDIDEKGEVLGVLLDYLTKQTNEIFALLAIPEDPAVIEAAKIAANESKLSQQLKSPKGPKPPPPTAPTKMLSLNDTRALYTAAEILWEAGIKPYLSTSLSAALAVGSSLVVGSSVVENTDHQNHTFTDAGVGSRLPRSVFINQALLDALIETSKQQQHCHKNSIPYAKILRRICVLLKAVHSDNVGHFLADRVLPRVVYALLILSGQYEYKQQSKQKHNLQINDRESVVDMVLKLLDNKLIINNTMIQMVSMNAADILLSALAQCGGGIGTNRPSVVTALRTASQGPQWVRRRAALYMKKILLSSPVPTLAAEANSSNVTKKKGHVATGGLEAVLQGYLDGYVDSPHALEIQQKLAIILTSVPESTSKGDISSKKAEAEEYYLSLCKQLVPLYILGVRNEEVTLVRVLSLVISRLATVAPKSAIQGVLLPLSQPYWHSLCNPKKIQQKTAQAEELVQLSLQRGRDGYDSALSEENSILDSVNNDSNVDGIICASNRLDLAVRCIYALVAYAPAPAILHRLLHKSNITRALLIIAMQGHITSTVKANKTVQTAYSWACVYVTQAEAESVALDLLALSVSNSSSSGDAAVAPDGNGGVHIRNMSSTGTSASTGGGGDAMTSLLMSMLGTGGSNGALNLEDVVSAMNGDEMKSFASQNKDNVGEDLDALLQLAARRAALGNDTNDSDNLLNNVLAGRGMDLLNVASHGRAVIGLLLDIVESVPTHDVLDSKSHTTATTTATNKDEEKDLAAGAAGAVAAMFLTCLSTFLGTTQAVTSTVVGGTNDKVTTVTPEANKAQCGILLMLLQAHVPATLLLANGDKVLQLLVTFLESMANTLTTTAQGKINHKSISYHNGEEQVEDDPVLIAENARVTAALHRAQRVPGVTNAHGNKNKAHHRPLIEEIDPIASSAPSSSSSSSSSSSRSRLSGHVSQSTSVGLGSDSENDDDINEVDGPPTEDQECLSAVLALLATLLSANSSDNSHIKHRSASEESLLRSMLPFLSIVAKLETRIDIKEAASEVALAVLTRGIPATVPSIDVPPLAAQVTSEGPLGALGSFFSQAEPLLQSDQPSERALGIRTILLGIRSFSVTKSSHNIPTTLTKDHISAAIQQLVNLLADTESFVYLNAIHAVAALASHDRVTVVAGLLNVFSPSLSTNVPNKAENIGSYRHRAVVAEALSVIIRRAGVLAAPLITSVPIVPACISVVKQLRPSTATVQHVADINANLSSNRMSATTSATTIDAISNVTVEANAKGIPVETAVNDKQTMQAAIDNAIPSIEMSSSILVDSLILRQSALSLLAECVTCSGWGAHRYIHDVIDIAIGILHHELSYTEASRLSRRTAAFMLRFIVMGLNEKLFVLGENIHKNSNYFDPLNENGQYLRGAVETDSGSYLLSIHRCLRLCCDDKDNIVKLHCDTALVSIGDLVRTEMTANLGVNEKVPKITILSSDR